jgi:hypothetical protein
MPHHEDEENRHSGGSREELPPRERGKPDVHASSLQPQPSRVRRSFLTVDSRPWPTG